MKDYSQFEDQYITVKGWMSTKLNLKGNKLFAFALVYGFSQDGQSEFRGSLSYIEKWLNASRPTAVATMSELESAELITKRQGKINGKTRNFYAANLPKVNQLKSFTSKETLPVTSKETLPVTSKETLPNNIVSNIRDNNKGKSENLQPDKFSKVKGLKKKIGPKHYQLLNQACTKGSKAQSRYNLLKGMYIDGRFDSLMDWLEEKKNRRQTYKAYSAIGVLIEDFSEYTPREIEIALRSSIRSGHTGIFPKRLPDPKPRVSASGTFSHLRAKTA